jgi:hypothetical protein
MAARPRSRRRGDGMIARLLLAAALTFGFAEVAAAQPAPVEAEIVRAGATFDVTYRLPRRAPAWVFLRSAVVEGERRPWRPLSFTVLTPGVRLVRLGHHDALVADRGDVPREVRLQVWPYTGILVADYAPALNFSNGAVALFADQFSIVPMESRAAVERLSADLNGQAIAEPQMRFLSRERRGGDALRSDGRLRYILFGADRAMRGGAAEAVVDAALPEWLRSSLATLIPALMEHHAAQLGPAPGGRPAVLASWVGPTPELASMNGGVLPGTIMMRFEGEGVLRESREMRDMVRWFIAHEGAHFWLGQAVRYERTRDAWITEGGADLLAIRAVQAIDPDYDWRAEINRAIRDCSRLSRGRGVAAAEERGEHRAYYACGTVFALAAEASSGQPFTVFVRRLIEQNRMDGVVTRAEWLAAVPDAELRRRIEEMLDQGSGEPEAAMQRLLQRAGVPHGRDDQGLPVLQ